MKDPAVGALIREINACHEAEQAQRATIEAITDRLAARHLNRLVPCRVRVTRHALDSCRVVDEERVGWLRGPITQSPSGRWRAYIEDMSPGDDESPSRHLSPRNLLPVRDSGEHVPTGRGQHRGQSPRTVPAGETDLSPTAGDESSDRPRALGDRGPAAGDSPRPVPAVPGDTTGTPLSPPSPPEV